MSIAAYTGLLVGIALTLTLILFRRGYGGALGQRIRNSDWSCWYSTVLEARKKISELEKFASDRCPDQWVRDDARGKLEDAKERYRELLHEEPDVRTKEERRRIDSSGADASVAVVYAEGVKVDYPKKQVTLLFEVEDEGGGKSGCNIILSGCENIHSLRFYSREAARMAETTFKGKARPITWEEMQRDYPGAGETVLSTERGG